MARAAAGRAARGGRERGRALDALGLGLATAGLLLCRNVTVAFLPALLAYAVLRADAAPARARAAVAAVALAVPVARGSRCAGRSGRPRCTPSAAAAPGSSRTWAQTVAGLAETLGPARLGIGAALLAAVAAVCGAACLRRDEAGARTRALAAFAVLGLLGQAALFAATYVAEPMRGRFLVFAALVAAIVVLASARPDERPPAAARRSPWVRRSSRSRCSASA